MSLSDLLAVARGDKPADLLLKNSRVVNVFSGKIEPADIAIHDGKIAGIGNGYTADETINLRGAFVTPGLVDAHVHIESSLCVPEHFASAVVPRGVTTIVADPHEIANVAGVAGFTYMAECANHLRQRINIVLMAPSCVPATNLSTAGAAIGPRDTAACRGAHGLAEMMNFPGVIHADPNVLRKLELWRKLKRPIDGHAPQVGGKALNAYAAAGIGSDHECVSLDEAREKLSRGMYVLIREATNARNLRALIPLITPATERRICLCTDDRTPIDLLSAGGIDYMLREIISAGVDPVMAVRLCTLNPAEWFGFSDRGGIAPGRAADLAVFEDWQSPARQVFVAGKLVAERGKWSKKSGSTALPVTPAKKILQSCGVDPDKIDFRIPANGKRIRLIGSLPDQLITDHRTHDAKIIDGHAVADPSRDVLKMAVIERHHGSGRVGLGFIQGIGLKRGAFAGTVAHDHHNLVVIGCDDESMMSAAREVAKVGGGLAVAEGSKALASLPLPVAGLMSDRPIAEVRTAYAALLKATAKLGSALHDPFMAMSFMALEVIPKLKLTDRGLVDVEKFQIVDLFV